MSVHEQVRLYLNQVRRRLQAQTAARGLAICGMVALTATIAAVLGANAWKFSDTATGTASALLWLALLAALGWFLVRPLLRRVNDARVARFVEEKHPEFKDRLVTAVDMKEKSATDSSARLFGALVAEDALKRTPAAPAGNLIESRRIFRPLGWAAGSVAVLLLLGLFGPGIFRYGTKVLWVGWAQAKTNPLYLIHVTPGDITVGRNTDQEITAAPVGFLPQEMRLFVQYEKAADWESAPMLASERGGAFHFLLMNVQQQIDYYVESNGVRSPQHTIAVIAVPRVDRLEVRYHFPAYAGLPDQVEQAGGDIMALKGTEVTLTVHTDEPAPGGRLALDDKSSIEMTKTGDRELQAKWTLSQDTLYHVRLEDPRGREARASEEYLMQAIPDYAPTVKLTRPGRDMQPTPIEEVVVGLEGQDDVRLAGLSLHYAVNGAAAQSVPLVSKSADQQAAATHLLPLEEYSLSPGDLITYYATVKDAASNTATSEMFFLQVRPFERSYTQSQSSGGGGGGGNQEGSFLSERQKEVISATWNVLRQKDKQKAEQLEEASKVLSEVQRDLQQQAETLASRIGRRELDGVNDEFAGLAENLEKAVAAMGPAAEALQAKKFQEALTPEQTALQFLLRAEALFKDIQVAFGNQGGGGGGGQSAGRDLTDLFSLELDTSKNQYETLNQFQGGQNNAEVQEALRKLQELARRQEELARQQRDQKDTMRAANRWEQEMLRRETEELARKLEQLSRQSNSSQLGQASRSLSQAARDMQQAGNSQQQGNSQQGGGQQQSSSQQQGQPGQQQSSSQQQASSNGNSERSRALERLREASNLLSGQQNQWNEQRLSELSDKAEDLSKLQEGITDQTKQMASQAEPSNAPTQAQREALSQLLNDKVDLLDGLRELEQQINQSAVRMAGDQKDAARNLRSAGAMIQEERMADKIRQGAWLSQRGLAPTAAPVEEDLRAGIGRLTDKLEQAKGSFEAGGEGDKLQRALETAERVRQGLEAMGSQPGQQGRQGQQGQQQAQQGQQGQPGQAGQQAGNGNQQGGQQGSQQGNGSPGNSQSAQGNQQGGSPYGGTRSGPNNGGWNGGSWSGGWSRYPDNAWNQGGYVPIPPDRPLTAEEQRAVNQQYAELRQEASGLRELVGQDADLGRLVQDLVRAMNNLDWQRFEGDPELIVKMLSEMTDRWKDLELRLRRELQIEEPDSVRLANQERVPERYRAIVEEYYRSLSKSKR
ncbi:MAG: hypothetical protein HY316_03605 [Acidobacteria bacterium]|nr:hypothetical protein [Acidobacteriota bacterium]